MAEAPKVNELAALHLKAISLKYRHFRWSATTEIVTVRCKNLTFNAMRPKDEHLMDTLQVLADLMTDAVITDYLKQEAA